jgi:ornithine decarboxylase
VESNAARDVPARTMFVCDVGSVVRRWLEWMRRLPRVTPYYVVRANACAELLAALASLGASFTCATPAELAAVRAAGATPDRIMCTAACRDRGVVECAKAAGVSMHTLESRDELLRLLSVHREARVVVRLLVDVDDDALMLTPLAARPGANLQEAEAIVDECVTQRANLVGFAFHVGASCRSPRAYQAALHTARRAFDLAALRGYRCTLLDVGGGFPGGAPGAFCVRVRMLISLQAMR